MACILDNYHNAEEDDSSIDWQLPISFVKKRHIEKIEGANAITQTWRMKERVGSNTTLSFHLCHLNDIYCCSAVDLLIQSKSSNVPEGIYVLLLMG